MPSYAIGITPLLTGIRDENNVNVKHVAYADDLGGAGKLSELRAWWDKINEIGPLLGYFPKASKSWLVVKPQLLDRATEIFEGTNVKITTEGQKYLGGFIGTESGKNEYIQDKIESWVKQLETLSIIAQYEPQAAYSAFVSGFKHRFTYHTRTLENIQPLLAQVDHIIDTKFIPAITEGRVLSTMERKLISLPVRLGGLGIPIISETCVLDRQNSKMMCEPQVYKIVHQNQRDDPYPEFPSLKTIREKIRTSKTTTNQTTLDHVLVELSPVQKRANEINQMKGSSSWLTSLPLADEKFVLNKREFYDAISIRYHWNLKRLPDYCACGKRFEINHAISCLKGGFVHRRHDDLRNVIAKLLDEVSVEVSIEPPLVPLTGEVLHARANKSDEARLDIATRGFWQNYEMAFFDVRVFNPFAKSYENQTTTSLFKRNENEKKKSYNERVIRIEHGSFTPLVFSANGGCGRETNFFLKVLAEKISEKKNIPISIVSNYIRTKISFSLTKSLVNCVRGSRSMFNRQKVLIETDNLEIINLTHRISDV